jgi:hypothetical protein
MDRPKQRFAANTRVRLREGVDPGIYNGYSRVGNEGWIRKRKRDKYGYPQVLIEWDKDHWAYNGQEDGWTWEGHFDSVEETEMSERESNPEFENQIRGVTEVFIKGLMSVVAAQQGNEVAEVEEPTINEDDWQTQANQAAEAVACAPAYIVITLEQVSPSGTTPIVVPRVFNAAREPELALIAQSQLSHLVSSLQDKVIADILQRGDDED